MSVFWNMFSHQPDDAHSHTVSVLLLMSRLWWLQPTVRCHGEGRLGRNMRHVQGCASSYNKDSLLHCHLCARQQHGILITQQRLLCVIHQQRGKKKKNFQGTSLK